VTERRWSAQFLSLLESLRMPTQFQQGRRYVRAGQVRNLTISSSVATANVLDDDGQTYRARVAVRAFSQADWRTIEKHLAEQGRYAAALLAGQLPDDLDRLLAGLGLSLFPDALEQVGMDCSCPSWQIPCAHLTAAVYALAEAFDADPFEILAWRGRGREELLQRLRALRHQPAATPPERDPAAATNASFWRAGPRIAAPSPDDAAVSRAPDAILEQLDPLVLTAGQYSVTELLRAAYRAIAR
jgi:uncharacterized Zn finger protein